MEILQDIITYTSLASVMFFIAIGVANWMRDDSCLFFAKLFLVSVLVLIILVTIYIILSCDHL